jgi:uncharacterized protein YndB with AHSA1/START domain
MTAANRSGGPEETPETADREIRVTRVLKAPRELVFQAWIQADHLARWWGPTGFTITTFEFEMRPGGLWRFVMHGPEGVDYQNKIVVVEIAEPERLVLDHVSGPHFRMTVTFATQGDQTKIDVQMLFATAAQREQTIREFGAEEGLKQTVGRLANLVESLQ